MHGPSALRRPGIPSVTSTSTRPGPSHVICTVGILCTVHSLPLTPPDRKIRLGVWTLFLVGSCFRHHTLPTTTRRHNKNSSYASCFKFHLARTSLTSNPFPNHNLSVSQTQLCSFLSHATAPTNSSDTFRVSDRLSFCFLLSASFLPVSESLAPSAYQSEEQGHRRRIREDRTRLYCKPITYKTLL